jgi:hypothetical protein
MKMELARGIIRGNRVILEEGATLPDGMKVVVMSEVKEPEFDADPFLEVDKWAPEPPDETPTDLAYQHDHYLYGIEKRKEEKRRRMGAEVGVVIDTAGWIALINRRDDYHQQARHVYAGLGHINLYDKR